MCGIDPRISNANVPDVVKPHLIIDGEQASGEYNFGFFAPLAVGLDLLGTYAGMNPGAIFCELTSMLDDGIHDRQNRQYIDEIVKRGSGGSLRLFDLFTLPNPDLDAPYGQFHLLSLVESAINGSSASITRFMFDNSAYPALGWSMK